MVIILEPIRGHVGLNYRLDEVRNNKYVILYHKILTFLDKFCRADLYQYETEDREKLYQHDRSLSLPNTSSLPTINMPINSSVTNIHDRRKTIAKSVMRTASSHKTHLKTKLAKLDFTIILSRLLLVHYIIINLGLATSIYYQYIYDYFVYHKRRLLEAQTSGNQIIVDLYGSSNITIEGIEQQLAAAKRDLKYFGSPLMEATYLAECVYSLMIILAFITYSAPLLHFRQNGPFDYYFIRMMMDWPKEQAKCNSMLREQVASYLESSRHYTQITLDQWRMNNMGINNHLKTRYTSLARNLWIMDDHNNYGRLPRDRNNFKLAGEEKGCQRMDKFSQHQDYIRQHKWTTDKLMDLYASGHLQPLNRSNPDWIIKMVRFISLLSIALPAGCFTWNICLFSTLPYFSGFRYQSDPMDIWAAIELGSLNVILTFGGLFYVSLSTINCVEQVYVVRKLQATIGRFIEVNMRLFREHFQGPLPDATADCEDTGTSSVSKYGRERQFKHDSYDDGDDYDDGDGQDDDDDDDDDDEEDEEDQEEDVDVVHKNDHKDELIGWKKVAPENATDVDSTGNVCQQPPVNVLNSNININNNLMDPNKGSASRASIFLIKYKDRMNMDLLYIMIHYKIFIAQLKPTKKSMGFVCLCSIGLMTIFPIIARLHLPYIKDPAAKVLSIIVVLLMASFADCCILPVCWKNSRCLGLYKSLSRLAAHLVELSSYPETRQLFDGHTFWLLRKELSHPDCLAGQFATASMGIRFTYQKLLKIHFWVSLVAISIYFELKSGTHDLALGDFLNDPLGIERNLPKL